MSEDQAEQRRCACGAPLVYERRTRFRESEVLAFCTSDHCGVITSDRSEDALKSFLIGDASIPRYLRPSTRFFFWASRNGFHWQPHEAGCEMCGHELNVALELSPRRDRWWEPCRVVLCLACGAVTTKFWMAGEILIVARNGTAWEEPDPAIQVLRRALEHRAVEPSSGPTWDFE